MSRLRIGVPPGVGDSYWALTKLKALAAGRRVTLCVQASKYNRALEWSEMVDFVAGAEFVHYKSELAEECGYAENDAGLDYILWPNAVLDRGGQLSDWLPHLPLDLDFPVVTPDMGAPRTVVYASSVGINDVWMPGHGPEFWIKLIADLAADFGPITLVGAAWDREFRQQLAGIDVEDLLGQTSLPQLAGIIRNARVVVGVICGVTILANHFRTPCVAVWPDHRFPPSFPRSWVAPDAPYLPVPASQLRGVDVRALAKAVAR